MRSPQRQAGFVAIARVGPGRPSWRFICPRDTPWCCEQLLPVGDNRLRRPVPSWENDAMVPVAIDQNRVIGSVQ